MSTLTLTPPRYRELGGEPTLDELITGVWEGLAAQHPADCPMCGRELAPLSGAGTRPPADSRTPHVLEGGRCRGCGTTLS